MSNLNKDLENNKIYFLQVHEKIRNGIPLSKVGDTVREVHERNSETILNASLHRSNKVTYWKAEKADGTLFRDKQLHKFLEDKGYVRELNDNGHKSEWFFDLPEEIFIKEFEEFISKKPRKVYELRPGQKYLSTEIKKAFRVSKYINLNACVRVGKSILSLDTAKYFNMFPCYIGKNLTSQSSVEKENKIFSIVDEMITVSLHGDSAPEEKASKIIADIKNANTLSKKIIFFVDEVDDASHTRKSRNIMKIVLEHFRDKEMFGGFITMTGTRAHRGVKVLKSVKKPDDNIKEIQIPYYKMQELQPEVTCRRNFTNITTYTENLNLSNISTAIKSSEGRKSIAESLSSILDDNNSFGIEYDEKFPNVFLKFSCTGKSNARALVKTLNNMYSNINGVQYAYFNINGNFTKSKEAEEYCSNVIKKTPNKRIVFVTQGMATTSFSVKSIGTSILFTDNEIGANDNQALHRSCTFTKDKNSANLILVTTNNSKKLAFDDIFEPELEASSNDDKIKTYKRILENNCITHILVDGKEKETYSITKENVKMYIDKKTEHQTSISSQVQAIMDEELTFLEDINIRTGSSSKRSKSAKPGKSSNQLGEDISNNSKERSTEMSESKREKILRVFFDNVSNMLAYNGNNHIKNKNSDWDFFDVDEEAFDESYSYIAIKNRWDSIYSLCKNDKYFNENYFEKIESI